jgi:protein O-GlcNAc transferase
VSAYFNDRPVGRFLTPLLSNHDRSQFEIFCYSDIRSPDSTTDKLRGWTDAWRETVAMNDGRFAELVRSDAIDILVDLGMHTRGNRMLAFARKPAPIQVTYLAYCSTTGLQTIDYRLSDPHLDPDDRDQTCYSERTIRLKSYWCYPPPADAPPVNNPPFATVGTITFGCLNDFSKVNPRVLSLWARILRTLPNSRLLLHCPPGNHRQRISSLFQSSGVDPNRIELMPMLIMPDYFRLYHHIDIALDPTPWPGGTTTCDSLWMGVPVITTTAKTAVSRGGASILSQLSLTDFVAADADQYVQLATTLASDTGRLSTLRLTLRDRMQSSPLMNAPGFTKDIEAAFKEMWETWRRSA